MSRADNILHAFGGTDPLGDIYVGDLVPPAGAIIHDTLKLSRCANGSVRAGRVVGGEEDCVDVNNHCADIEIIAEIWEPRGDYLATIKGGSRNITLRGRVRGHGRVVDIDVGNLSDQSDDLTYGIALDLEHDAGDPIRIRVLNGLTPKFLNADTQRYVVVFKLHGFWRSLWAKACAVLKRLSLPL